MRFPSLRSHNMATPSLPPDAHREPSGETVTALMYPVWPTRLVRSLQLDSCHTLTSLSQPPDTMSGWEALGEKDTHETHLEWPSRSDWMVYLHSPRVFHSLMVLSRDPDTICLLSAEKATERTSLSCPTKRRVVRPVLRSHRRSVPSHDLDSANWPSEEMTTSCTKCPCPRRAFLGYPYDPSSRVSFHHHGLVARGREDHIWVLVGGSDGAHPPGVALEGATHSKVALFGTHGRFAPLVPH